jgi:hypothetical protein
MQKPCVIHVRLTAEEFSVVTLVAKQRGIPVSKLVREKLFQTEPAPGAEPKRKTSGAEAPALPGPRSGEMMEVRAAAPQDGRCEHGKRTGELCYKCDERFGYPAIRSA